MKILIINTSEPLPFDQPVPRNQRTGMLVNELLARGHEIVWVSSAFNHHSKAHRLVEHTRFEFVKGLKFVLLNCPKYSRNVSVGRLVNHLIMGMRLKKYLSSEPKFDVIYCSFPPIELAYVAAEYGRHTKTPILLDARDRWPELIVEQVPKYLQLFVRAMLIPYYSMAKYAFTNATEICGTSEGMVNFGLEFADGDRFANDEAIHMSFQKPSFSQVELSSLIKKYQTGNDAGGEALTICFFGTFVSQRAVDFETCIDGLKNLSGHIDVRLIMCGDGPRYHSMFKRCDNVDTILLPGRVSAKEMWAVASIADVGLLPYKPVSHFEFSIPNKVPEYLASGLPILTSLTHGTVHSILKEKKLGIFYESGNLASFISAIDQCVRLKHDGILSAKRLDATSLYENMFDPKTINKKFATTLERISKATEL